MDMDGSPRSFVKQAINQTVQEKMNEMTLDKVIELICDPKSAGEVVTVGNAPRR